MEESRPSKTLHQVWFVQRDQNQKLSSEHNKLYFKIFWTSCLSIVHEVQNYWESWSKVVGDSDQLFFVNRNNRVGFLYVQIYVHR